MPLPLRLHPDRLFPSDPDTRAVARRQYDAIKGLQIVSPHGHTDPSWFATNAPWADTAELLITPDHVEHRLEEDEAHEVARALTYDLVKKAYKL